MRDHERPLNARGRSEAPEMGAYMARHGLDSRPRAGIDRAAHPRDLGAASPARCPARLPVVYEDASTTPAPRRILAVVKETAPAVRALLVIGHNPGLHETARLLIASGDVEARERLNEGLPTAALAVIDFAGEDWRKLHAARRAAGAVRDARAR